MTQRWVETTTAKKTSANTIHVHVLTLVLLGVMCLSEGVDLI